MNESQAKAKALTDQLLANLASGGEMNKVANATIVGSDQMVAEQMANQPATPRSGHTVTQTLEQLILQGIANGAHQQVAYEELAEGGVGQAPAVPNGSAMGSVGESPEQMKVAAITQFVNDGYTVDQAYSLLKQAEENMAREDENLYKAAQINDLVRQGMSVTEAVEHIKVAEEVEASQVVEMAKAAAVNALVAEGVDTISALQAVQASWASLSSQA
jgi:hypothetical protein